jgi:ribose transport system substrate-binding protein
MSSPRVAVVLYMQKNQPWSDVVRRDISDVLGARPSISVEFADPEGNADKQLRLLEGYLEERQRVSAVILAPIDPQRTRPLLEKYRAADIPVVIVDTDVGDSALYRAIVLVDNRHIGRQVGEFYVEATGGVGDIVEIRGIKSTAASTARAAGFRQAIAGHPKLRIVEECAADWLYDRAQREFARILTRRNGIDGVFAHNDEMARGAYDAAVEAGREDEMLITGIDALPGVNGVIRMVSQGRLAATFLNPSPGKHAAMAALAIIDGEPCLKKTLLKSSSFQSNKRIRAWRDGRRK